MQEEIRINRPPQMSPEHMPHHVPPTMPESKMRAGRVVIILLVIVLVALGYMYRGKLASSVMGTASSATATSSYQAVFLSNGQVYFGKISDVDGSFIDLKDVYYLQVVQQPIQGNAQNGSAAAPAQSQQQVSLVKLGNELHGPQDEMHINRSQVLFYEDLKSDSQVIAAINSYNSSKK